MLALPLSQPSFQLQDSEARLGALKAFQLQVSRALQPQALEAFQPQALGAHPLASAFVQKLFQLQSFAAHLEASAVLQPPLQSHTAGAVHPQAVLAFLQQSSEARQKILVSLQPQTSGALHLHASESCS